MSGPFKMNPGRGPKMKTGAGVPSALLQVKVVDEKKGSVLPEKIHDLNLTKVPTLSKQERELVSESIVNESTWKNSLEKASPKTFDAKWGLARKNQRAKDSATIVDSRLRKFESSAGGTMLQGHNVSKVQGEDLTSTGFKKNGQFNSYKVNKFRRNKQGDVEAYQDDARNRR